MRIGRVSTDRINRWCWSPWRFFCRLKVTSSIVITLNHEYNSVPKEETFPIPLKHIDLAKSTHTDLDVMQEKRIDDCWNVDSNRNLSVHGKVSRSLLYWKKKLPKDVCGLAEDWQNFNRLPDQIMYGQRFGRKWVKPLRIGKNKKGQRRRRSTTMLGDREGSILSILTTKNTK